MFSIVIYDKKKKALYLIRDRLGTKPLYFTKKNGYFYFASEIKALPVKKNINNNNIKNYLDFGKYPVLNTFFNNINNVPASTVIKIKKNNLEKIKYFNIEEEVLKNKNEGFSKEKFEDLLKKAVSIRQRSDKKINFHLSGGIDSTALLIYTKDNWSSKYDLSSSSYSYFGYKDDEYKFISRI